MISMNGMDFFFYVLNFGLFLSHKDRRNKITVVQDEIVQPGLSQRHVDNLQQRCSGPGLFRHTCHTAGLGSVWGLSAV